MSSTAIPNATDAITRLAMSIGMSANPINPRMYAIGVRLGTIAIIPNFRSRSSPIMISVITQNATPKLRIMSPISALIVVSST